MHISRVPTGHGKYGKSGNLNLHCPLFPRILKIYNPHLFSVSPWHFSDVESYRKCQPALKVVKFEKNLDMFQISLVAVSFLQNLEVYKMFGIVMESQGVLVLKIMENHGMLYVKVMEKS